MAAITIYNKTSTSFYCQLTDLDPSYGHGGRTAYWEVYTFLDPGDQKTITEPTETLTDHITDGRPHSVSGLTQGDTYTVHCYIVYSGGDVDLYEQVTVGFPETPTATFDPGKTTITVDAWGDPSDLLHSTYPFHMELSLYPDGTNTQNVYTDSPYTFTGLTPGTQYLVQVWARYPDGTESEYSAFEVVTTLSGAWTSAKPYIYVNGAWAPATAYIYQNGAWEPYTPNIHE